MATFLFFLIFFFFFSKCIRLFHLVCFLKKNAGDRRKYSVLLSIIYTRQHTPDTSTSMALHIYNVTMQEFQPSFFICCLKKNYAHRKNWLWTALCGENPLNIIFPSLYFYNHFFLLLEKGNLHTRDSQQAVKRYRFFHLVSGCLGFALDGTMCSVHGDIKS